MVTVTVKTGNIKVNSGWVVRVSPGLRWYEFDLRAKYAEVGALSGATVLLGAGEHTLHTEGSSEFTEIAFHRLPDDEYIVLAEVSRYTLTVIIGCYPKNHNKTQLVYP
jgi:hypothetical protein